MLSDHCLSVPKDYESRDVCDRIRLFYIAVYGISIIENLGQLGIPIPNWVKERLTKLQDSNENPKPKVTEIKIDYGDGQSEPSSG